MDMGASITAHRLFEASVIVFLGPVVGGWDVWTTGEREHKYIVRGLVKHANTLSANAHVIVLPLLCTAKIRTLCFCSNVKICIA